MAIIERMKLTISHDGTKKLLKVAKWEIFQIQIVMMPLLPGSRMGQGRVQLCRSIRGAQEDKGKDYC